MSKRIAATSKRSSYLHEADACVVLEITDDTLLAGFSGEHAPRCRIPLPSLSTADLGLCEDMLERALRQALNRFLYIELKNKRVMLVEQHFLCIKLKQVIARVLFTYQQARELQFMSGSVCSCLALGLQQALVVSLDAREVTVVPVFDSRPLNKYVRTTILAGDALAQRARYLLQTYSDCSDPTAADIADFLARAAVCLAASPITADLPDIIAHNDLERLYKQHAPPTSLAWTQPSSQHRCTIPQWIRFACVEVLFEGRSRYADFDETALPQLIQQAYRACPIDVRAQLTTLVLTGSASQIRGLPQRLAKETQYNVADSVYGNEVAWAGASLAASIQVEGPALLMTAFNADRRVPDWSR
ncbi:actin-domain-containing protein [Protomyces lactucae-debilis]|uniref:Actin-domain-containing protein n=1 Tax=Protomyces lactucae-debilis TaxID=2754530 RepID=A0A1Y2F424_PROLT|nr:actin-domain-containing protein [Protomyces lactucae-debilis]ORY78234.1 actin-domain-containing protein [Protomyces lactucae-debilis]